VIRAAVLRRRRAWHWGWLCLVIAAAHGTLPARASASLVLALSLEDMTRRADVIALVSAVGTQARREKNGSLIVTDVSLQVETALKGRGLEPGSRIVATVLGGKLDDLALQVPGEANFALGQRVIVFLQRSQVSSELRVVGMSQGVLPLFERGGTTLVAPGGQSSELVEAGSDGELRPAPSALLQPQPLGELLDRIRRLVQSP
jgi:hypothetical protein